ncbi:hypothetical protein [Isorropodon fossajaponicum symbiont]|uniref:hypothetical protein n=1 Tax=Isorropodon fossajaponicum symbiont TaxID=883811 RepID=UPI00315AE3BD
MAALTLGTTAQMTQALTAPFLLASVAMIVSGLYVLIRLPNRKNRLYIWLLLYQSMA